jgi:hypothetical protein
MRSIALGVFSLCALAAAPALAERPDTSGRPFSGTIVTGELTPTPEMWFYERQMNQYQDPEAVVRQKAEFRAEQRAHRLAAMRWFGFSNVRPRASSDPIHGDYSPHWGSNNQWYPSRWTAVGRPWVVAQPGGTIVGY